MIVHETYVECDGCHFRVRGTLIPDTWRNVKQSGKPERHYCTAICVQDHVQPTTQRGLRVSRAHALGISTKNLEALGMVAAGHTNREIAAEMGIALQTAKNRLGKTYLILGADDRTQAVAIAHYLGLVDLDALGTKLWRRKTHPDG